MRFLIQNMLGVMMRGIFNFFGVKGNLVIFLVFVELGSLVRQQKRTIIGHLLSLSLQQAVEGYDLSIVCYYMHYLAPQERPHESSH